LLAGETARDAVRAFAAGDADLVLGGTFADLPFAAGAKLPRGSLRFDPASGLFGLLPRRSSGPLGSADARRLLSQAIDRDSLIAALAVPNLAARATVLEPGLDGTSPPLPPAWTATPLADRLPALQAQARKLFPAKLGAVRVQLPDGPGGDILLRRLQHDWGVLGLSVVRASSPAAADFQLIDRVAPSASPAWFVRRFRCEVTPVCDEAADEFMDSARATAVPAERYSMLGQAAEIIDGDQLFIPLTAPIRWSLVSARIKSFAGNRFAVHSLSDLDQKLGS
jgi:peptide/nickel transport system substrate-binding protein